jgi:hypothetical protein
MLAARRGSEDLVRFLAKHRANVQARNRYGDTALMLAALKGHGEVVKILADAGAEVDHKGWTPLAYAAFEGHADIVRYLLGKGARADAVAPNGATPLMLAAKNGHVEAVKVLLAAGADPNFKSAQGATALSWAKQADVAALLKQAGAKE